MSNLLPACLLLIRFMMIAPRGSCERSVSGTEACQTTPVLMAFVFVHQLKALVADPHPHMDLYVNESDISFLKIIVEVCRLPNSVNLANTAFFSRLLKTIPNAHIGMGRSFSHATYPKPILAIPRRLGLSPSSYTQM